MTSDILDELKAIRKVLEETHALNIGIKAEHDARIARHEELYAAQTAQERETTKVIAQYYEVNPWKRVLRWIWPS